MKNKLTIMAMLICALAASYTGMAQGFIGTGGSGTDIGAVNSGGTLTNVNVGIGVTTAASGVTLEVKDQGRSGTGFLGLQFDNLPTPPTTSDVLYYDPGTGLVTYGPTSAISGIDYDCGVGTVTITLVGGATIPSTNKAWLLSGSTTASTDYFGTHNNDDIRIATNNGSCSYVNAEGKMVIGSDANNGNVEIGWDGVNSFVPSPTNYNKFLVQNGAVSPTPMNTYLTAGYLSSDVAIYAYANETTDPNNPNIGIVALADNAGIQNNIGMASLLSNAANSNKGFVTQIMGDNMTQGNNGYMAMISGNNTPGNIGFNADITGNNAIRNQGFISHMYGDNVPDAPIGGGPAGQGNYSINVNTGGIGSQNIGCWANTYSPSGNTSDVDFGIAGFISTVNYRAASGYTPGSRIGVYGGIDNGADGTVNYGVWGDLSGLAIPASGNTNPYFAVYGIAPGPSGSRGSGTSSTIVSGYTSTNNNTYAGFFDGDVFCSNTYYYSDPKLKENIADYKGALDKLKSLPVKSYTFKQSEFPTMNFPVGDQVGVLSTDIKKVFPNLVKGSMQPGIKGVGGNVTFDAVNYTALIPVLVEAVQELDAKTQYRTPDTTLAYTIAIQSQQLSDQAKQIAELRTMIEDLCSNGCAGFRPNTSPASVSPNNTGGAVLYQSTPNPTSGSAVIAYAINMPFSTASIQVSDKGGKAIRQYSIQQQGAGSVTFDGGGIAAGSYTYALIIDGKIYDTKTMVIVKD